MGSAGRWAAEVQMVPSEGDKVQIGQSLSVSFVALRSGPPTGVARKPMSSGGHVAEDLLD